MVAAYLLSTQHTITYQSQNKHSTCKMNNKQLSTSKNMNVSTNAVNLSNQLTYTTNKSNIKQ